MRIFRQSGLKRLYGAQRRRLSQPINSGVQWRGLSQSANPLNPRTYGLDEAYATDLAIGIRDQLKQTDPLARALIGRTGIDGMSLGALNPPAWYSLVIFSNILRTQLAGKIDPSDVLPLDGFTHTAGEGNIPNQDGDFETPKLLRDASGEPLLTYSAQLFYPQIFQFASGQFLKGVNFPNFAAELKGGQSAKDAIGGRVPGSKNTPAVADLRGIKPGIDVPSPNNVPTIKSVEELILWRIKMELLTGHKPIIKLSGAYNVIARALAVARAGATLNLAGGQWGRTGGTAASENDIRTNTVIDGLTALRAIREAFATSGLDTDIHFSNNFFTPEQMILGWMHADKIKIGTAALVWLEQCVFAKKCHENCPKNITTNPEKFNPRVVIDQLPAFFNVFNEAANIAREIGIQDKLAGGRLSDKELSEVLRPTDHSEFSSWLASQQSSNGQPIQAIPVSKISDQKSGQQLDDEARAESLFTETDDVEIHLDGAPGAIGFFSRFQKNAAMFADRKFIVQTGGTYFGGGNQALDLYANAVSDFAGNLQNGGQITIGFAGRQCGVGLQGGQLYAAHVDSEAGYRMGTATLVVETGGDSFGHYVGNGLCLVLGQSADYDDSWSIASNPDVPLGRLSSLGINPFAAAAGGTFILPRRLFQQLLDNNQIRSESLHRLAVAAMDTADIALLNDTINDYVQKMRVLNQDRWVATSLLKALESSSLKDVNQQFIKVVTADDFSDIDSSLIELINESNQDQIPEFVARN